MTISLRIAAAVAAASLAGACVNDGPNVASSRVDPVLVVLRDAGMMGTWASDCAAGPSKNNWHVTYYGSGGVARRRSDRGPAEAGLDGAVDAAMRQSPTLLRMKLRNDDPNWGTQNGESYDVIVEIASGYRRTLQSVGSNGVAYIQDGRLRDGQPSPMLTRCRA
jgi:hypothetical protein